MADDMPIVISNNKPKASGSSRPLDPAWAHAQIIGGSKNSTMCLHCNKKIGGGGITRFKLHLAGIRGQVQACSEVPEDVKWQMRQMILNQEKNEDVKQKMRHDFVDSQAKGDIVVSNSKSRSRKRRQPPNVQPQIEQSRGRSEPLEAETYSGPRIIQTPSYIIACAAPTSEPTFRHSMATSTDRIQNARLAMARWWYDANVPFDAAKSAYYQPMLDAITSLGPGFVGPSYHDYRGALLRDVFHNIKNDLTATKNEWKVYGCSILADIWTNHSQKPIINFLVYSPSGTAFLKSIDASGIQNDVDNLFVLFDQVVREVGPDNVVQFITANYSSYKAAGKALQERYGTFLWSPCAVHCIDLMLQNFADPMYFPDIHKTIKKARNVTKFIYNHAWVLSLMREEFTNGRDLCRPAVTRFATHFQSLLCFLKFKKELCQMFSSNKWVKSSYAKSDVGKEITTIILHDVDFWVQCLHIVKISEPLVRVLHLVNSEQKPCMGYLYEAMEKAKETIKTRMKNKASLYGPYVRVIDARWEKQLHSPVHAAGCFLNPGIFFRPLFTKQREVTRGLLTTVTTLVSNFDVQEKISEQIEEYKKSTGDFGLSLAIRQREKLSPVAWWEQFGNGTPQLQRFAIRVLSQCCSATRCDRNRNIFEFKRSKAVNRLENSRLNDLVFTQCNLKLQQRILNKDVEASDPISLDNMNLLDEWVSEESDVLDGEDFNWETIEAPCGQSTLEDEEVSFADDEYEIHMALVGLAGNEVGAMEDDEPYVPPQDQDPYVYVTEDV